MEIKDIKAINLKDGDVLLVEMRESATEEEKGNVFDGLKKVFPNVKKIVFGKGELSFTKITQEESLEILPSEKG